MQKKYTRIVTTVSVLAGLMFLFNNCSGSFNQDSPVSRQSSDNFVTTSLAESLTGDPNNSNVNFFKDETGRLLLLRRNRNTNKSSAIYHVDKDAIVKLASFGSADPNDGKPFFYYSGYLASFASDSNGNTIGITNDGAIFTFENNLFTKVGQVSPSGDYVVSSYKTPDKFVVFYERQTCANSYCSSWTRTLSIMVFDGTNSSVVASYTEANGEILDIYPASTSEYFILWKNGGGTATLVWDGTDSIKKISPTSDAMARGIYATSVNDIWVATLGSSNPWTGTVQHFNGTGWSSVLFDFCVETPPCNIGPDSDLYSFLRVRGFEEMILITGINNYIGVYYKGSSDRIKSLSYDSSTLDDIYISSSTEFYIYRKNADTINPAEVVRFTKQ